MADKYDYYCMIDDIFKSCDTSEEMVLRCTFLKDVVNELFKQNYTLKVAEEKGNG